MLGGRQDTVQPAGDKEIHQFLVIHHFKILTAEELSIKKRWTPSFIVWPWASEGRPRELLSIEAVRTHLRVILQEHNDNIVAFSAVRTVFANLN